MGKAAGALPQDLVDPDEPATWPRPVLAWAEAQAGPRASRDDPGATSDLGMTLSERDAEFRGLFEGRKVLAYHFTRLLDEEADDVREFGLLPLSEQLVRQRLARAAGAGELDASQIARLERSHVFALNQAKGRTGQVCLAMGRESISDTGCHSLLSCWGGEAIYWSLFDSPSVPRLGKPSIVVVRIDVSRPWSELKLVPDLAKLFVGRLLGTTQRLADVFRRAPIPPADVLAIWQPGDPSYDGIAGLPAARPDLLRP